MSDIDVKVTSPRWNSSQIENEVTYLKQNSPAFRRLLGDIPDRIGGVKVNGITVTDDVSRFPNQNGKPPTWSSAEQTQFDPDTGTLYVGINPAGTRYDHKTGRPFSIGELIAHGLGHFTQRGLAANGIYGEGIITGKNEEPAVDYQNDVARDFGLSPVQVLRYGSYKYGPLYNTFQNPREIERPPTFLSRGDRYPPQKKSEYDPVSNSIDEDSSVGGRSKADYRGASGRREPSAPQSAPTDFASPDGQSPQSTRLAPPARWAANQGIDTRTQLAGGPWTPGDDGLYRLAPTSISPFAGSGLTTSLAASGGGSLPIPRQEIDPDLAHRLLFGKSKPAAFQWPDRG